jgi:hypothetical protein
VLFSLCGNFSTGHTLAEYKIITTLHKYYTLDEYREFFETFDNPDYIAYTLGIRDADLEQLTKMAEA